jgi:hypothetical protein
MHHMSEEKTKARPRGAQEYKGNGKHGWEQVASGTQRLRVPGGWLYGTYDTRDDGPIHHTVFVPVPEVVGYAV